MHSFCSCRYQPWLPQLVILVSLSPCDSLARPSDCLQSVLLCSVPAVPMESRLRRPRYRNVLTLEAHPRARPASGLCDWNGFSWSANEITGDELLCQGTGCYRASGAVLVGVGARQMNVLTAKCVLVESCPNIVQMCRFVELRRHRCCEYGCIVIGTNFSL